MWYAIPKHTFQINDSTLFAASGEYSDFQFLCDWLDINAEEDEIYQDGDLRSPREYASVLSRVLYNRRNKMDPLLNQVVVAGVERNGKSYLGYVDLYGTLYEDDYVATGYGSYLAVPLLREKANPNMSEAEAVRLLEECMRILFYRDCRTCDNVQFGRVLLAGGAERIKISDITTLESKWDHKLWVTPTVNMSSMLGASW